MLQGCCHLAARFGTRKIPIPADFLHGLAAVGCPLRLEKTCQERAGNWQRRPLLAMNTALSTLSQWRGTMEATPTPNLGQ